MHFSGYLVDDSIQCIWDKSPEKESSIKVKIEHHHVKKLSAEDKLHLLNILENSFARRNLQPLVSFGSYTIWLIGPLSALQGKQANHWQDENRWLSLSLQQT